MSHRALFLDRDGIFNELVYRDGAFHSPRNWGEVKHFHLESLKPFKDLGFKLILVTNQPDIERGIISHGFVEELNAFYFKNFELDAAYVCPFSSNEHPLKKPNPGMFLLAKKEMDLDLSKSFLVGDTDKDVIAARNCGVTSIVWERDYNKNLKSDFRVTSIKEIEKILRNGSID